MAVVAAAETNEIAAALDKRIALSGAARGEQAGDYDGRPTAVLPIQALIRARFGHMRLPLYRAIGRAFPKLLRIVPRTSHKSARMET